MDEKKAPSRQGTKAHKNGLDRLPPDWETLLTNPMVQGADSRLDDRRGLLEVAYEFLIKTKAEPNTVLAILRQAKKTAFIQMRKRQGTKAGRERRLERNIHAERVRSSLPELEASLIGDEPSGLSEAIADVLKRLEHPSFLSSLNGKIAQFRKGAPSEPWIEEAKAELSAAGVPSGIKGFRQRLQAERVRAVPSNFHDALLMAVGLLRYHLGFRE